MGEPSENDIDRLARRIARVDGDDRPLDDVLAFRQFDFFAPSLSAVCRTQKDDFAANIEIRIAQKDRTGEVDLANLRIGSRNIHGHVRHVDELAGIAG